MNRVNVLLCSCLLLLQGVALASESEQQGQWQLVGKAQLRVLFFDVYESRLYTEDGRYQEGQRPIRLDIHYQRDITASKLLEQTRKEWRHLGVEQAKVETWSDKLKALWPDVGKGDLLSFDIDEHGKGRFTYNGTPLGVISDSEMTTTFLHIWLSPNTSRPEHRAQLITP
ncbi:chalcone isomerase family protein [Marinimicrobium sp. ABcell2]|uniref:chalcone isomerase family protein n=1 Tax=Marinimicrobium sp. ABcell2 TaxID=3069751 RepID=UPI0027AE39D3|nr:chalcone isomerase family protein [Marinimicrobium sp. ABcell2]MDQ2076796.1 chalcone isomerase family protein [Marinimicrobium sp. ABcell2]